MILFMLPRFSSFYSLVYCCGLLQRRFSRGASHFDPFSGLGVPQETP